MPTVTLSIADTAHDGSGRANAPTTYDSNDLRSGTSLGTTYAAGWWFAGLTVPKGATIISASFTPGFQSAPSGTTWGSVKVVGNANCPAWAGSVNPYAVVSGLLAAGAKPLVKAQTSYDMKDAVQALVNLSGWASGNAVAFATDPTGNNGAFLFNDKTGSTTKYTATLVVEYSDPPPPTLDPSLDKYTVHANAPVGYVAANILGKTSGSTLSNAYTNPKLERVGTEFRVKSALTKGEFLAVGVTETLAGASNSPFTLGTDIEVVAPRVCEFIGQATGTTKPVIPTHQAGDLIVVWMFRDGNVTAPALPAGFTNENTGSGTLCSFRLAWKIATDSATSGGAATTATSTITHVYRPNTGYTLGIGSSAQSTGTGANVNYQVLAPTVTDGTSWVGGFSGHRNVDTALETPPAGMVFRSNVVDATDEASGFDTNGGVTSWAHTPVAVGGTASGWKTVVYEIKGVAAGLPITGTASVTLGVLMATGSGSPSTTGAATAKIGPMAAVAAGAPATAGQGFLAVAGLTVSAQGALPVSGQVSGLLGPIAVAADGGGAVSGSASAILGSLTLAAFGGVSVAPVDGVASLALASIAVAASGGPVVSGAAGGGVSFSASAVGGIAITGAGTGAVSLSLAAAGSLAVTGAASASIGAKAEAYGAPIVSGAASTALAALQAEAEGATTVSGEALGQIEPLTLTAEGTVRNLRIGRRLVIVVG